MPVATKLSKVVTYLEGFPPIKSHEPLIAWSPLTQYLWPLNLAG